MFSTKRADRRTSIEKRLESQHTGASPQDIKFPSKIMAV